MVYIINQSYGDFQQGGCLYKPTSGIQWTPEHTWTSDRPQKQASETSLRNKPQKQASETSLRNKPQKQASETSLRNKPQQKQTCQHLAMVYWQLVSLFMQLSIDGENCSGIDVVCVSGGFWQSRSHILLLK